LLVLRFASCEAAIYAAGIGGSSTSCIHAKHGILPFLLGKRSLLVMRMASCHAIRVRRHLPDSTVDRPATLPR
jgi:hypothetical protein